MAIERHLVEADCASTDIDRGWRDWLLASILALPVVGLYAIHAVNAPPGFGPSGFVQYDQLYYMANARELLDSGGGLTYGNPFSPDYTTAKVYFQPITAILAAILWSTGADPGTIFVAFGAVVVLLCLRTMIALYRHLFPLRDFADHLGLLIFAWGGGLLVAGGLARMVVTGDPDVLAYDPGAGWWFLNLGRNLVYPTEALYHLLFLGAVLQLLRRRWATGIALAAVLSASHPFTGIELLGILFGWWLIERFVVANRAVPNWFGGGLAVLIAIHVAYYLVFLHLNPEHRSLFIQWRSFEALLTWKTIVLAYAPVGGLALWSLRRGELVHAVFAIAHNRLFAVWFAGAFVLANNDLLIQPIQPLHFTRGYIWTPLFLLGAPLLVSILRHLVGQRRPVGLAAAAALTGIFLFDNAAWILLKLRQPVGLYLTTNQRALFDWLGSEANRGGLVLANPQLAYSATAYTPLRGWLTHYYNTPFKALRKAELDALFTTGKLPAATDTRTVLVIRDEQLAEGPTMLGMNRESRVVYRKGTITVWRVEPEFNPDPVPKPRASTTRPPRPKA